MKKFNPIEMFQRWLRSRAELLADLDRLRLENEQLRNKVATLQHAKELAERSLEERRREKQVLRSRLNSEKKASVSKEVVKQQLSDKVAELREENDRLKGSG